MLRGKEKKHWMHILEEKTPESLSQRLKLKKDKKINSKKERNNKVKNRH